MTMCKKSTYSWYCVAVAIGLWVMTCILVFWGGYLLASLR